MVTYEAEQHDQLRNATISFVSSPQIINNRVLSASLYFPPTIIRARISYQRRRYFCPRIHLDIELKPRIDSTGQLSYQTEINFAIKRGSKFKMVAEMPIDAFGRVRVLSTPYSNLCVTNAGSRKTVIVEHDGETNPWRIYWDRFDPHHIRIAPLGE